MGFNIKHPYKAAVVTVTAASDVLVPVGAQGPITMHNQGDFKVYLAPGADALNNTGIFLEPNEKWGIPSCTNGINAIREDVATTDCTVVVWYAQ
jgi:hypothetical protein